MLPNDWNFKEACDFGEGASGSFLVTCKKKSTRQSRNVFGSEGAQRCRNSSVASDGRNIPEVANSPEAQPQRNRNGSSTDFCLELHLLAVILHYMKLDHIAGKGRGS